MDTKRVYSFHPRTREFAGHELAHESPLEPGVWHVPANATEIAPPDIPNDHICRWDGHKWTLARRFSLGRTGRDARRDADRRLSEFANATVEACYAREHALREYVQILGDNTAALDAFDPAEAWNS